MRKRPTRWDAWCCNTMPRMPSGPLLRDRMWRCVSAGAFPFRDCRFCDVSKRPVLLLDFLHVETRRLLFQEPLEVGAGAGDVPHAGAGQSAIEAVVP